MEERLDKVEERLDRVEERLDKVEERLDSLEERFDQMEVRQDKIEIKLNRMENRLDCLTSNVRELRIGIKRSGRRMDAGFEYLAAAVNKVDRRLVYKTQFLDRTDKEIIRDLDSLRI